MDTRNSPPNPTIMLEWLDGLFMIGDYLNHTVNTLYSVETDDHRAVLSSAFYPTHDGYDVHVEYYIDMDAWNEIGLNFRISLLVHDSTYTLESGISYIDSADPSGPGTLLLDYQQAIPVMTPRTVEHFLQALSHEIHRQSIKQQLNAHIAHGVQRIRAERGSYR